MTHAFPGRFIAMEGIDGSGKSTQARLLAERLRDGGGSITLTREPGGTDAAERIRALLLDGGAAARLPLTDVLLMSAARYEHIEHVIRPALARGDTVICDRFRDSTYAYQCAGQGADRQAALAIQEMICGDCTPDDVVILTLPPAKAFARLKASGKGASAADETYYERLGEAFYSRVNDGFLECATQQASNTRYHVLDAMLPPEELAERVCGCLR